MVHFDHESERAQAPRKVAIITGAGTGIGAAVAANLLAGGWRLLLTGRREAPLQAVAAIGDALVVPGDVRSESHANRLVEEALNRYGRLDGLVLSAGMTLAGSVAATSTEKWRAMLDTNLTGPFLLCREALPHLRESKGSIVGIGSIAAKVAGPELAAYGVAKAGFVRLMQAIAVDEGPNGVRANAVNPGWIRSEMADSELSPLIGRLGGDLDEVYAAVTRQVPSRRAGTVEEAAAAVAWLLSEAASYVNGTVLTVDGGTSIVDVGTLAFEG